MKTNSKLYSEYITHNFIVSGQKWGESQLPGTSGGTVQYSFAESNYPSQFLEFDRFMDEPNFQDDIRAGFRAWEEIANLRFEMVSDSEFSDIRFGWADIDGPSGVLGDATIPSAGELDRVIVRFDQAEDWATGGNAQLPQLDFRLTATHEIGHAIGILHSDDPNSLMFDLYNQEIQTLQDDDVEAVVSVYGSSNVEKVDVFRFFRTDTGGHFFTADKSEKESLKGSIVFRDEGVGFNALESSSIHLESTIPIFRFFNTSLGSHFYTASIEEKEAVLTFDSLNFEGVGFRAYQSPSTTTDPVYRFFNLQSGGHFYTADVHEKNAVMEMETFRYEGIEFYAYLDTGL